MRCTRVNDTSHPWRPSLDMGIGNTTASSAMTATLLRTPAAPGDERGTGIDDEQLAHKIEVIEQAFARHAPNPGDPLDVLMKVGGLEIAGLVGVIVAAASRRVPIVIDGFISGADGSRAQSAYERVSPCRACLSGTRTSPDPRAAWTLPTARGSGSEREQEPYWR
jgi:NaMN:DMB phosphoribosyltransferase